jgi:agmatine deiminase
MSNRPTFRLIPEWDPQQAVLINWPQSIHATYIEVVKTIALTQSVMIVCYDVDQRSQIQRALIEANINLPRVRFYIISASPVRTRDHGPFTLRALEQTKILNFRSNDWAEKYAELYNQSFFPQVQSHLIDLVLEGGSVETDGLGTILTTRRGVLGKNHDCHEEQQIELCLREHLGVEQIVWLDEGYLEGDLTSGQVDTLARFVNPQTICYTEGQALQNRLSSLKNRAGQPYRLLPLPMPEAIFDNGGRRLPATYTKFLITNHLVLLPFYQTPQDSLAKSVLQSCFPTREVVGVPCRSLLENHGSIHGIALQIPV